MDFDPRSGLVQHVGFRGRASLESWDPARARRILARYLGEDEAGWDRGRFVDGLDDPGAALLVRLEPEEAVVRDVSYPLPRAT